MGIFNFFKKKDDLNLKEWQDLLLGNTPKLIYSKNQLTDMSYSYIKQQFKIVEDSVKLVNNTCNVEVFFNRFNLLLETLKDLSKFEKFVPFKEAPSESINRILLNKDITIKDFIERSWDSVLLKNEKLKTEKAKVNKINNFFNELNLYKSEFGTESLKYINKIQEKYIMKNLEFSNIVSNESTNITKSNNTKIEEWNISISFGKSSSSNYERAIFLAKESSNYYESGEGKNIVHQATYSANSDSYLAFIKLYQLVGSWKSCFIFINGEITDKKIIGKLNYCYGDKCRSGNDKFCYGASEYTLNPFGCHRLQISNSNTPWWSIGYLDSYGIWHVDKKTILEKINQHYIPYKNCPSFSYDKVIQILNQLPDTINVAKDNNWEIIDSTIYPKDYYKSHVITLSIR